MLTALLKLALIEAKAVGTAAEALSSIQAAPFDLYMLDSRLPDVDGFELCRRLRAMNPHAPILFFSGAALDADKKKGIEAGADLAETLALLELVDDPHRLAEADDDALPGLRDDRHTA